MIPCPALARAKAAFEGNMFPNLIPRNKIFMLIRWLVFLVTWGSGEKGFGGGDEGRGDGASSLGKGCCSWELQRHELMHRKQKNITQHTALR